MRSGGREGSAAMSLAGPGSCEGVWAELAACCASDCWMRWKLPVGRAVNPSPFVSEVVLAQYRPRLSSGSGGAITTLLRFCEGLGRQ